MPLKKQIQIFVLLNLTLLFTSCSSTKVVLHPITNQDFCVKGAENCDMEKMDIGMSEYYLKEVLQAKVEAKK